MRLVFLLPALVLLFGCTAPKIERRVTLKVAVNDIYCTDTACACIHHVATRTYPQTLQILADTYAIDLQLDYFIEPYQLEEAILAGAYDGVVCKPWFALRLRDAANADLQRIVDLLDPDNNQWLTGIVIVPTRSPITSLAELTGKHIYLGEPDAYEKHHAARRLLAENGIVPARIDTRASCGENIGVLLDQQADAAVVSDYALSADCAVDFARPEDFRILAHTEKIPLTSLMLDMNKVDPAVADRLKHALLELSGRNAPETLLGKGFVHPQPWNPAELEVLK